MRLSGFTFIRNAVNYDFPIVECISSMLDLVDEMVIALGDSSDNTEELVRSIKSDKIRIISSNWDESRYNKDGMVYAHQTDVALRACTGDWCIYLQGDEVLHESAIPIIRAACMEYLGDDRVEGFLLPYRHFYADYEHYIDARHFGYPKEVRIVRNLQDVHSWRDAQSFRIIPGFDYNNYWQKEGSRKLNVVFLQGAYIFHYGWCRDPRKVVQKQNEQNRMHSGESIESKELYHDYGNVDAYPRFKGSHPSIMSDRISAMDYAHLLRYSGDPVPNKKVFGIKYRILGFIERLLPNGNRIFGFKNYRQIAVFRFRNMG